MKYLPVLFIGIAILHGAFAPPVTPEKETENKNDLAEYMEYHRYLNEVVQALESDPEFKSRLQKATEDEVRSGSVAHHLEFVNHNVRTKLDEIKRRELERLRHLTKKQHELALANEIEDSESSGPGDGHLDHGNPHTFEIEDLKRLIKQVTSDLEKADKLRKEEFKEYEMQKEFEQQQSLDSLDETHKAEAQKKLEAEREAKKHHQPLHHPGSRPQLEEVWEKQDHMDQQFDPKVFFMMHDVNGDGVWDAEEVKALFVKELDKMYGPGAPNQDRAERAEEMERMREHVFYEVDRNRDGLIDFREFVAETQKADFNQDQGWQPIDENQIYTKSEYEAYERRRLEELRYLQNRGLVDAHGRPIPGLESQLHEARKQIPYNHPPPHQGYPPQYQAYPQQGYPPQQQGYQQVHQQPIQAHQQAGGTNQQAGGSNQAGPSNGQGPSEGHRSQGGNGYLQGGQGQQQGPPQGPQDHGSPPGYQPHVPAGVPAPHGIPAPQGNAAGVPMAGPEHGYPAQHQPPPPPPPAPGLSAAAVNPGSH